MSITEDILMKTVLKAIKTQYEKTKKFLTNLVN